MVNGKLIERNRTTRDKTAQDLLNCANLPSNSQICFLDDLYHPKMDNENIYYINVDPYTHNIPFHIMAERYYKYNSDQISNKSDFINFIIKQMNTYKLYVKTKSNSELNIDKENGEEIFNYLRKFFKLHKKQQTKKHKQKNKNKNNTRKNSIFFL